MLLSHITRIHIEEAAKIISRQGIPQNYVRGIYRVVVKDQEYPFKYLMRIAHTLTEGNDKQWLKFVSKKQYRDFVEDLGYEIKSDNLEIPFFTPSDILDISDNSLKKYDPKSEDDRKISKRIRDNAWAKTEYWLKMLKFELEGYETKINKAWSQRGWNNGKKVAAFKPYTWAKIYRDGDEDKHIYFTIGIDGGTKTILFKLDYKQVGNALSKQQKSICERLVRSIGTVKISLSDLHLQSWDSLIEITADYIYEHSDFYTRIVEDVWNTNQKRISRLAFNTNGWIFPSGPYGKSSHLDSHEARHGYGHEEWIFDTGKVIDDYHYGFLEPIRKQQGAYQGNKYDVWLYTIDAASGKRFWIGEIQNVEVLNSDQAFRIKSIYKANGWLNEMESQIRNSGGNDKGFSNWEGVDLFNVRFKLSDMNLNDNYVELPIGHSIYNLSRYSFAYYREDFTIKDNIDVEDFSFQPSTVQKVNSLGKIKSSLQIREPRIIEITYLHQAILEALTSELIKVWGENNVRAEHPAGYNSNRIDIVVNTDTGLIFYEIKTYQTLKNSIREAIGQLLEYGLWTNQKRAKELIIITQPHKNIEKVKTYLSHLRTEFNMPLYYQSFDTNTGLLSEKV